MEPTLASPDPDLRRDPDAEVGAARVEAHADAVFARLSPYRGAGLANHCRRVGAIAGHLLARRGVAMRRPLLHAIAMVHDLGLLSPEDEGASYPERSRALFRRELPAHAFGFTPHEQRVADECLLYNHRLFPVPGLSAEAEAFREAIWVEHSRGHVRAGLDRGVVRGIFAALPRDDFDWVLVDFARRVLVREPWTVVDGIFF